MPEVQIGMVEQKEKERRRAYYLKNREKKIAQAKAYYLANREKKDAYARKYEKDHPEKVREYRRKHRLKDPEGNRQYNRECMRKWRKENPERSREKTRESLRKLRAKNREGYNAYMREWRKKNPDKWKPAARRGYEKHAQKLRTQAIQAYGGKCLCCGERDAKFLVVDHINGGGNQHRREIKSVGGYNFYRWLKQQGFPTGYQTLCWNCNYAKKFPCPHTLLETPIDKYLKSL